MSLLDDKVIESLITKLNQFSQENELLRKELEQKLKEQENMSKRFEEQEDLLERLKRKSNDLISVGYRITFIPESHGFWPENPYLIQIKENMTPEYIESLLDEALTRGPNIIQLFREHIHKTNQ